MSTQVNNIESISVNSPSYIANNRRFKKISESKRRYKKSNPFAADYNRALRKWEYVVQTLLSKLTIENDSRILKYSEKKYGSRYREIDFVAQPSPDKLIFCELKLKENYKKKLRSKESGWAQLNKSIAIASKKYSDLDGLSICVDMSHIYGLESTANPQDYCKFSDLKNYFTTAPIGKNTLWISSSEIADLAMEQGLLTHNDVCLMKKLYQEYKNPLSVLDNQDRYIPNNPFEGLGALLSC